jgi:hypothetical protein
MQPMEQAASKRWLRSGRWFRFSLRTLLVLITLISLVLGCYIVRVRNEQQAALTINEASGAIVYDWQIRPPGSDPAVESTPPGPAWIRKFLGPHWLDRIVEVRLNENSNPDKKNRFALVSPHLEKLQLLRSLQLYGENCGNFDFQLLGRLRQLEELTLYKKTEITQDDAAALAAATHLRELHIKSAKISAKALSELAAMPNLEELDIDCFYFEPSTGKTTKQYQLGDDAAEVLANFPKLRSLMVFQTQIRDKGLAALCRLERLETLVVSSPSVTSASFDAVVKLKHLKHLGTWQWKINDADFAKLSQLPNLRSLGLVTRLSDESVTHLVKLDQIERLTIRGPKITDDSLPNLARFKKLEWLDMSDTSVHKNSPAAKELQHALPHCQINLPRTNEEEEMHRAFINSKWSGINSASGN